MPGDLLKDTYVYKTLAKKFNNFLNPAIKVKVVGKDLKTSLKVGIVNVNITLEEENASSTDFSIVNVYDLKSSSFISSVMSSLKLGETITVELGYGSELTEVFSGYIDSIVMNFSGMPTITVKAFDIRRLMKQNKVFLTYKEKPASTIVTEILQVYGKYSKTDITATKDKGTPEKPLKYTQIKSDLEFVQELAKLNSMEFIVVGGKACFREMHTSTDSAMMTLEKGDGLISFTCSKAYCEVTIKVFGHNENTNTDILVEKEVSSDKNSKMLLTKKTVKEIREATVTDETAAKNIAAIEMDGMLQNKQTGSGSCIGLPMLIPGRYLTIGKLDTEVNKTYYLTQVVHSFSADGFTTNFTIGGWQ